MTDDRDVAVDDVAVDEVLDAERRRCEAWLGDDVAALAELLADDIWYVHTNGVREDKAQVIETCRVGWVVSRSSLDVRLYDDVAVVTGGITVSPRSDTTTKYESQAIQVWLRRAGRWQLVTQQSTPLPS
jgi:hypothetical protein